jgi:predicted XRE-type DNA-binding protein
LRIIYRLEEQPWTDDQAAARLGIDRPRLAALVHWRLERFTPEELRGNLAILGQPEAGCP